MSTASAIAAPNNWSVDNKPSREDAILHFFGSGPLDDLDVTDVKEYVHASSRNTEIAEVYAKERQIHTGFLTILESSYDKTDRSTLLWIPVSVFRKEISSFRNETAQLIAAIMSSPFYSKTYKDINTLDNIGLATKMTGFESNSFDWLKSRIQTIGGSDIGALAAADFHPDNDFAKHQLSRVEKSKNAQQTDSDLLRQSFAFKNTTKGALYRGTVWEDKIRDDFARDYVTEFDVYNVKDQFARADLPWARINIDGLISAKDTMNILGIFEAKTASSTEEWYNNSIPTAYRAQALYYLYVTDLDFVHFRVLVNDSLVIERVIYKNEEVFVGSGVKMPEYIQNRVLPWFENLN